MSANLTALHEAGHVVAGVARLKRVPCFATVKPEDPPVVDHLKAWNPGADWEADLADVNGGCCWHKLPTTPVMVNSKVKLPQHEGLEHYPAERVRMLVAGHVAVRRVDAAYASDHWAGDRREALFRLGVRNNEAENVPPILFPYIDEVANLLAQHESLFEDLAALIHKNGTVWETEFRDVALAAGYEVLED